MSDEPDILEVIACHSTESGRIDGLVAELKSMAKLADHVEQCILQGAATQAMANNLRLVSNAIKKAASELDREQEPTNER